MQRPIINKDTAMVKRLYVGNLSYKTNDQGLADAFAQAGTVESANVVMERETGRSKGFGFVEMSTEAEAEAAIAMWDGKELDGRPIRVSEARPKVEGGAPRGDYR